jgi:hypothetical protein
MTVVFKGSSILLTEMRKRRLRTFRPSSGLGPNDYDVPVRMHSLKS